MFNNHFMSWIRLCTKTELIAERARGNEERSAFSNHGGADFLEPVDGRIFSINVVTYIGIRHRFAHGRRRLGDGIASEVDHVTMCFCKGLVTDT